MFTKIGAFITNHSRAISSPKNFRIIKIEAADDCVINSCFFFIKSQLKVESSSTSNVGRSCEDHIAYGISLVCAKNLAGFFCSI